MIYSYAVDPDVASTWGEKRHFRYFGSCFGLGSPRILHEVPKFSKWRSQVLKIALKKNISDNEKKRLTELVQNLGKYRYKSPDMHYDGNKEWLLNAETEYDRNPGPFGGILSNENPRLHDAVIIADDIGMYEDSRWGKNQGDTPQRQSEAMARTFQSLLIMCKHLNFVDPHFGPENSRHKKVFQAFIKVIAKRIVYPEIFNVHCSAKAKFSFFKQEVHKFAKIIPHNLKVSFYRWKERKDGEKFHNRYILTDLGGVIFGIGLDDGFEGETDDTNLLSPVQYQKRISQFNLDSPAFDLADDGPIVVYGSK